MMKSRTYIALLSCITMMSGCVNIEEFDEPALKVSKTFYAETEEPPTTKTVLGTKEENRARSILWMPEDRIGVVPASGGSFDIFVNKNTEASNRATFEGETVLALNYFAIYPYDENATITDGTVLFTLKREQSYKENSFNQDAFPMIARSSETNSEGLKFSNLCGLLEINLTGEEKVTKITFSSDKKVSGTFKVATDYDEYPEMIAEASGSTSTTLNCGEGVQLKTDSPTPFYFVLPPGTYETFTLLIQTSDGKRMFKKNKNPLNLKRSHITTAGGLEYVESVSIDLSLHGTANSYVISDAGMYSFDASVIGNGSYGIISGASFHTEDPNIAPASVEVLWESTGAGIEVSEETLLTSVRLDEGCVNFISTGAEGNALVAVKDENGTILWSWHLWFTDAPVDYKYVNSVGTYTVQDRNLGATRSDRGTGEEWKDAKGILYEWGRKDPFVFDGDGKHLGSRNSNRVTIDKAIADPMMFAGDYWGWETTQTNTSLWLPDHKTIYDPCPVGYKVIKKEVWQDFSTTNQDVTNNTSEFNVSGAHNNGWDFYYDGSNTTYIPATDIINYLYQPTCRDNIADLWSSNATKGSNAYRWNYEYWDESRCRIQMWYSEITSHAMATRCMKDDGHVDLALPVVEMVGAKDATAESVTLTFNVMDAGASSVTESGIIYGTTPALSIGSGQKVAAAGSEYKVDLTGLTEGTKYYAVAYATNSFGTSYSKEISFYTKFASYINLSEYGTSNSYIISEPGAYTFDASVRGNSIESVGSPALAEVLWESVSCTAKAQSGAIISELNLDGGFVQLVVRAPLQEGNALIAVKDVTGTILWSWHIWVTDIPKDHKYVNTSGSFIVQDRNLGATRADHGIGDEWKESCGIDYFWGRKDPFMGYCHSEISSAYTVEDAIRNPTVKDSNWGYGPSNDLWAIDHKTVYDPCPVGYRVAVKDVWSDFSLSGTSGSFDNGWYFLYNGTDSAWYSNRAKHSPNGIAYWGDNYLTAAERRSGFYASSSYINTSRSVEYAALRCMREHDINVALTTGAVTEVTKTSANIHGSMGYLGAANLLEMGFVWSSTNESPDLNSSKIAVDVKEGEFSKSLTNLSPGTTYYVRTFATEGNITIYGNVVSFTTQVSAGNEDIPEDDEYDW